MISENHNISTTSSCLDFSSAISVYAEPKYKTELRSMVYSEKHNELETVFTELQKKLVKNPSGKYLMEFDVEGIKGGMPSKFKKQQVYNIFYRITDYLEVSKRRFFWWIATYTNLADNMETVKTMHRRATK